MRTLPHEVMGVCPNCLEELEYPVIDFDYNPVSQELEGLYCNFCSTPLHLWWMVTDFVPAITSAYIDRSLSFSPSVSHLDDPYFDIDNDFYDDDDDDTFKVWFWKRRMVCCDKRGDECICEYPLSWNLAVEACLTQYDTLTDFYEYYQNNTDFSSGHPSCFSCSFFNTPACYPLRLRVHDYAIGASSCSPISICQDYSSSSVKV